MTYTLLYRFLRKLFSFIYVKKFNKYGTNINFDPISSTFSYSNINIGKNVFIGKGAFFSASHSKIIIGENVMFGPEVHIYGGNHVFNQVGVFMHQIMKNTDHIDEDIIIEDDVWIGGKVIILSGVVIGRGAIVGAGSIVTKNIKPYSIAAGNPAKQVQMRFSDHEIKMHEKKLY